MARVHTQGQFGGPRSGSDQVRVEIRSGCEHVRVGSGPGAMRVPNGGKYSVDLLVYSVDLLVYAPRVKLEGSGPGGIRSGRDQVCV